MTDYKLPNEIKINTILDAGSGCGETMLLFSKMGINNFVCVEINKRAFKLSRVNAELNGWGFNGFNEPFRISHLKTDFDLVKMDIEGGEKILLELDKIDFPVVLEVHSNQLKEAFQDIGFTLIRIASKNEELYILNNYEALDIS